MRTFKQFKVGDIDYNLSFESFTHIHPKSYNRAYLRIVGPRELIISISKYPLLIPSIYRVYGQYSREFETLDNINLAQEIRRIIMLFLTNSL